MVKNQAHGWSVWAAMMTLFLAGVFPLLVRGSGPGIRFIISLAWPPRVGIWKGKEVRFGVFNSALFATVTTDAFLRCGELDA